jgi:hypothetical protein
MKNFLQQVLDWSEVWALLIPLIFIIKRKNIPDYLRPVSIYVWITLILNIAATLIWKYKVAWGMQPGDFLWSNNFLYNTHSIIRLLLFSWFFILLRQPFMRIVKLVIPAVFLLFVLVNFIFFENFFDTILSSRLLAVEAALLIFYCLQYFIYLLLEERGLSMKKRAGFWVVAGLSIYVATAFFIFLFYTYLATHDSDFAYHIWDVHNIVFIILCLGIARAFYGKNE